MCGREIRGCRWSLVASLRRWAAARPPRPRRLRRPPRPRRRRRAPTSAASSAPASESADPSASAAAVVGARRRRRPRRPPRPRRPSASPSTSASAPSHPESPSSPTTSAWRSTGRRTPITPGSTSRAPRAGTPRCGDPPPAAAVQPDRARDARSRPVRPSAASSFQDSLTFAYAAGAPITSVMAILQHSASAIAVLADGPIDAAPRPRRQDVRRLRLPGRPPDDPGRHQARRRQGRLQGGDAQRRRVRGALLQAGRLHDRVHGLGGHRGEGARDRPALLQADRLRLPRLLPGRPRLQHATGSRRTPTPRGGSSPRRSGASSSRPTTRPTRPRILDLRAIPGVFDANPKLPHESARYLGAQKLYVNDAGLVGPQTLEQWTGYSVFLYRAGTADRRQRQAAEGAARLLEALHERLPARRPVGAALRRARLRRPARAARSSVALLLLAWEAYVRPAGISPLVLPSPSRILSALVDFRDRAVAHGPDDRRDGRGLRGVGRAGGRRGAVAMDQVGAGCGGRSIRCWSARRRSRSSRSRRCSCCGSGSGCCPRFS